MSFIVLRCLWDGQKMNANIFPYFSILQYIDHRVSDISIQQTHTEHIMDTLAYIWFQKQVIDILSSHSMSGLLHNHEHRKLIMCSGSEAEYIDQEATDS